MKYAPYSYSKMDTFEKCPRRFKYKYIDKVKVPQEHFEHLDKGKFVHLLLQYNGDVQKVKEDKEFKTLNLNKDLVKESYKIYKEFVQSPQGKSILKRKELMKEFPLGLDKDLELINFHDTENLLLRGYIDAAYVDEKTNTLLIVDWKTGKKPQKVSFKQLLFYSLGLFSEMEQDKIILVYAYVESKELVTQVLKREDVDKYKKALYDSISKIENETDFPKKESHLCDYCPYMEMCLED
jgi:RecB family exonuclease